MKDKRFVRVLLDHFKRNKILINTVLINIAYFSLTHTHTYTHTYTQIQVPFRLLKSFHKIQQRLIRELEKKFSGKDVVLVGSRRMLNKTKSLKNPRPRSRTLTAVHQELLGDLVYPSEIVGKRTRYKLDGSKTLKVYLDPKDQSTTEYKLDTFSAAYKKMTGTDVVFEFPVEA